MEGCRMTLANVRDWLKSYGLFQNYYIGRLATKKQNSLGVYSLADDGRRETIGGLTCYEKLGVSLLIHGTTNKDATEKLALALYKALEKTILDGEKVTIGGTDVYFLALRTNRPVDVDQDASDSIYEYVVELDIYYQKGE
jgi:hypothetical protein